MAVPPSWPGNHISRTPLTLRSHGIWTAAPVLRTTTVFGLAAAIFSMRASWPGPRVLTSPAGVVVSASSTKTTAVSAFAAAATAASRSFCCGAQASRSVGAVAALACVAYVMLIWCWTRGQGHGRADDGQAEVLAVERRTALVVVGVQGGHRPERGGGPVDAQRRGVEDPGERSGLIAGVHPAVRAGRAADDGAGRPLQPQGVRVGGRHRDVAGPGVGVALDQVGLVAGQRGVDLGADHGPGRVDLGPGQAARAADGGAERGGRDGGADPVDSRARR